MYASTFRYCSANWATRWLITSCICGCMRSAFACNSWNPKCAQHVHETIQLVPCISFVPFSCLQVKAANIHIGQGLASMLRQIQKQQTNQKTQHFLPEVGAANQAAAGRI